MAALLDRTADWIWNFDPDRYTTIAATPYLQALHSPSMRLAYLGMDAAGRTGAGNPLTRLKVRQAIASAIDRPTMARLLVQGSARVLDAPCYPTQFGCDAAIATRYPYDPPRAKQLLAEAGFKDGFSVELVSAELPRWADAVKSYLGAVGIDAHLTLLQAGPAADRAAAGENPLALASWGSYSVNDVSAILPYFFGGGPNDYARDPAVEAAVAKGDATTDPDERRKYYSEAIQTITANADWLPMYTYVTTYGVSAELSFIPYPDELPRFYLSHWR